MNTSIAIIAVSVLIGIWIGIDISKSIWERRMNDYIKEKDEKNKKEERMK